MSGAWDISAGSTRCARAGAFHNATRQSLGWLDQHGHFVHQSRATLDLPRCGSPLAPTRNHAAIPSAQCCVISARRVKAISEAARSTTEVAAAVCDSAIRAATRGG